MLTIYISFQIVGFHRWPDAAKKCPEQAHLAHRHRHVFFFELEKEVTETDRQIEILQYKSQIEKYLRGEFASKEDPLVCEFGNMSCEMLAVELCNQFKLSTCLVKEDNENGSRYTPIK